MLATYDTLTRLSLSNPAGLPLSPTMRSTVRRDQEEQAKRRLRYLIEEGLPSGPGRRRTKADEKELLAIARGEID